MKPLKFKNPKLQKAADFLSGNKELAAIIILVILIILAWRVERAM